VTVMSTTKDPENLTLTIVAEFDAPADRVWSVWEDARKLEKWWGPPTYPATFTRHDFVVGGQSRYFMTGPTGDRHHGYWQMRVIEKPDRIDFANGLADDNGEPSTEMQPMDGRVTFEATPTGTRMIAVTHFVDVAQMETMLAMGMAEGMPLAINQIDALLDRASV
jgi:uncharacterized protein YndB with AHSA1/START domain